LSNLTSHKKTPALGGKEAGATGRIFSDSGTLVTQKNSQRVTQKNSQSDSKKQLKSGCFGFQLAHYGIINHQSLFGFDFLPL
jgi:hypothetical protein